MANERPSIYMSWSAGHGQHGTRDDLNAYPCEVPVLGGGEAGALPFGRWLFVGVGARSTGTFACTVLIVLAHGLGSAQQPLGYRLLLLLAVKMLCHLYTATQGCAQSKLPQTTSHHMTNGAAGWESGSHGEV